MKLSKEFIAMFREEAKKAQWEINCWNGKSIDDLVVDYLERKELKPKDITGTVCLSVEEAYDILWDLRDLYKQTYGYEWVKNEPWFDEFKKRIEQAKIEQVEKGDGQ